MEEGVLGPHPLLLRKIYGKECKGAGCSTK